MGHDSSGTGTDSPAVKQIVQRAKSDWLSLRRTADHAARHPTLTAVNRLSEHLSVGLDDRAASVLDLGAGTGSNLAWLGPRLGVPQAWTLIDRDGELLRMATSTPSARVVSIERHTAEFEELATVHRAEGVRTLVTCSALLDVLTTHQVDSLCRLIASLGACALLSLTVTGEVRITPAMDLDERIDATFNAHQGRHTLAGPGATAIARRVLAAAGFDVQVIPTPWELTSRDAHLIERYLIDRVASAVAHDPELAELGRAWLAARLRQVNEGTLTVRVGHEDLVAIPPSG